jgi:predicted GNAT superfamily acetyltransferase
MADIYTQHAAAFAKVSAFVILDRDGERVATVAIKFPRDGAGRLYAYVHWFGVEMKRGHANGYGYDKRSAAVADAARRIEWPVDTGSGCNAFAEAATRDGGEDWTRAVEKAGFRVLQAV